MINILSAKKLFGALCLALLLLFTSFPYLLNGRVLAAGETYAWQDNTHITVKGGVVKGQGTLTVDPNSASTASGAVQVTDKNTCKADLSLSLSTDDTGGQTTAKQSAGSNCSQQGLTNIQSLDGQTVSVGGAPPSSSASSTEANSHSCEQESGNLGWILCSVIDYLAKGVDGIYQKLIVPMLTIPPLDTQNSRGKTIHDAWSAFRIYGNILLVIALLVVVFGQSIGGGLIDAYTVNKTLPRIIMGAVFINLSYYVVAFTIDVSNILGLGIRSLLTGSFGLQNNVFDLGSLNGSAQATISGGGIAAILGAGGAIWASAGAGLGAFVTLITFGLLLPLLFVFIGIMGVLAIRMGLIYLLVLSSPVAFALYCLPNTEKYFKRWWETLQEVALVFPIVSGLFGLSAILAQTTIWATGSKGVFGGFGYFVALVIVAMPLVLIPFAFKLASGLIGKIHEFVSNGNAALNKRFMHGKRDHALKRLGNARLEKRQDMYTKQQAEMSSARFGTRWKGRSKRVLTTAMGLGGGYNIEAAASASRAEEAKILNDQIATGKDEEIRGLTVNKHRALAHGTGARWNGSQWINTRSGAVMSDAEMNDDAAFRIGRDGNRQFKSLGGAWINEADVDAGHRRWRRNSFAQQAALAYEMRKAQSENQLQGLAENYQHVAQGPGGWGMSDEQAGGAWIGAAFEHQNAHLEFKYTDWSNGRLKDTGKGFVDEVYEKRGSYPLSQMSSNTIEQLKKTYNDVTTTAETRQKIAAIAETFMHELGAGTPLAPEGGDGALVPTGPESGGAGGGRRMASTPGAAHVAERVRELAVLTGRYNGSPPPRRIPPAPAQK